MYCTFETALNINAWYVSLLGKLSCELASFRCSVYPKTLSSSQYNLASSESENALASRLFRWMCCWRLLTSICTNHLYIIGMNSTIRPIFVNFTSQVYPAWLPQGSCDEGRQYLYSCAHSHFFCVSGKDVLPCEKTDWLQWSLAAFCIGPSDKHQRSSRQFL